MRKVQAVFENICVRFVLVASLGITCIFAFWAGKYFHFYPSDYSIERITETRDNPWYNFTWLLLSVVISFLVQKLCLRGDEQKKRRFIKCFAIAEAVIVGVVLCFWVFYSNIVPYWDAMQVYLNALDYKHGNYLSMTSYMKMWPQQYGLTFIYELLFALTFSESYKVIQYFNVLCIVLIIYLGYKTVDLWFQNASINLYYLVAMLLFLPLHIYSTYAYGDVICTAAGVISAWAFTMWMKSEKKRYACILFCALSFGTIARKNTLIIVIAVAIMTGVYAISKSKWHYLTMTLMLILVPVLSTELIKTSYEWRSGIEVEEGIPAMAYIAMGVQESYNGCGVYTGYVNMVYTGEAQGDSELCTVLAKDYLQQRTSEMWKDKAYVKEFYRLKLVDQWDDQTFSSLIMNAHFDGEPKPLVQKIFYGEGQEFIVNFMNRYLFVLYAGVAICALYLLVKKPELYVCLPFVILIGGVLFSILWEAKGRYVLPYVVAIIPYMAAGIYVAQCSVKRGVQWGCKKWKQYVIRKGEE